MQCGALANFSIIYTLVVRRVQTVSNVDFDVNEDLKLLRHKCAFHPKFSFSGTPQRLCIPGWKCCLYNVMPTKITDLHSCNGNGKSTRISAAETLTAPGTGTGTVSILFNTRRRIWLRQIRRSQWWRETEVTLFAFKIK